MHEMTKLKVNELVAQTGHEFCFADFELVQQLDEIAGRVHGIFDGHERAVYFPVEAGNVRLYPMTIAKSEMLAEYDLDEKEFVYLLSLPNDAPSLPPAKELKRLARKQWRKMTCTEAELAQAIAEMSERSGTKIEDEDGDKQEEQKPTDWPAIIDLLCSEYGSTPESWMYDESMGLIIDLIARVTDRKQQGASSEAGKAPLPTKRMHAILEFKQKANEILKLWSAQNG